MAQLISIYPINGEVFELTLDGDDPAVDPIVMVRADGFSEPEKWRHTGRLVVGKQTCRFKLVSVGFCRNLDEVRQKLVEHGEIPGGQWREAFKASYPKSDNDGPIGVIDFSWVSPRDIAHFPFIFAGGGSSFCWVVGGFDEGWRWLVQLSK